jgi:hypothetical protein
MLLCQYNVMHCTEHQLAMYSKLFHVTVDMITSLSCSDMKQSESISYDAVHHHYDDVQHRTDRTGTDSTVSTYPSTLLSMFLCCT